MTFTRLVFGEVQGELWCKLVYTLTLPFRENLPVSMTIMGLSKSGKFFCSYFSLCEAVDGGV